MSAGTGRSVRLFLVDGKSTGLIAAEIMNWTGQAVLIPRPSLHEVAGRVGWLLTELFALDLPEVDRRKEEMMRLGREFGLALQTVNVIRGLHEDWERGWIYIPRSFLPHPDFTPEELFHGRERRVEVELSILRHLVEKADRHLAAARRYIAGISRGRHGIRLFCLLPLLFAVRTLAVSRDNPAVFERETKMTRSEVERIIGRHISPRPLGPGTTGCGNADCSRLIAMCSSGLFPGSS